MKKGSYVVQEVYESSGGGVKGGGGGGGGGAAAHAPHHAAAPDSSYSSCLLALLFFLALCIIIMLAAWPWNQGKAVPPLGEDNAEDRPSHGGLTGDEKATRPPSDKSTTSTTTKGPQHPHPEEPHVPKHTTVKQMEPPTTYSSPQEEEDGNHRHHHPYPGEGHHPVDGEEHHPHPHEPETTTTPRWESERETTQPQGHVKGWGVKDGQKRPVKGLRPRIGGDEDDEEPSAEWVGKTQPGEVTESPGDGKLLRIIVDASGDGDGDKVGETPPAGGVTGTTYPTTTLTGGQHTEQVAQQRTTKKFIEGEGTGGGPGTTTTSSPVVSETEGPIMMGRMSLNLDDEDKTKEEDEKKPEVCQTASCKSVASRMLALMDHSVSPCDDFYQYACGGMSGLSSHWISEEVPGENAWSRISDMLNHVNQFSPMSHKKFKSFHDSCIFYDLHVTLEERIHKVHDIISNVGRFYMDTEWKQSPGNVTVLIGNLLKHHFSPLFDIHLDVDAKSPKFSIKLTTPVNKSPLGDSDGVALNGWISETCKLGATQKPENKMNVDLNERYKKYMECSGKHEQYIFEVKTAIDALGLIKYENDTVTQKLITDTTLYLDILLAETGVKTSPSPGEKRRVLLAKEFRMLSLRELSEKFPMIQWKALVSMLLDLDIAEETEIQVYFEDHFQSFFENLTHARLEERQINNALMAMFAHELYYGLVMTRSSCNRKAYCLNVAKELMDPVASALFLQSFEKSQLSAYQLKITSIFKELLTTLKLEIGNLEWMDKNSQILALEKLQNLKLFADGGISAFLNEPFLESLFAKEAVNKAYLENVIDLMRRYRKRMYEGYLKNPFEPEQIWSHFLLPYRENGVVIYGLNSLVVPYGQMFKPFFSEEYPLYIQMSGLGFMIAHEIWHQFDTTGIKYDSKGHRDLKFSEETMAAINKTVKCAIEQTDLLVNDETMQGEKFSYRLDPSISLNERLVDIGGAHLAFKTTWGSTTLSNNLATLPWTSLTPQQLYFLSLAQNFCTKSSAFDYAVSIFEDEHLPPFKRVNDIVSNSLEFSETFSCTVPEKHPCKPFTVK
ncbi:endothelin-converting enzyme 2-like [Hetaerina americana]|uniref:endothelin-converting enzyme 2-like n=1 Tax=Hetaerina americana TaxID=62018 RepID=UPI003A7F58A6